MQAAKLAPSRLHWKLAVASLSVNENDALVAVVGFGGIEVIVGAGGGERAGLTTAGLATAGLTTKTARTRLADVMRRTQVGRLRLAHGPTQRENFQLAFALARSFTVAPRENRARHLLEQAMRLGELTTLPRPVTTTVTAIRRFEVEITEDTRVRECRSRAVVLKYENLYCFNFPRFDGACCSTPVRCAFRPCVLLASTGAWLTCSWWPCRGDAPAKAAVSARHPTQRSTTERAHRSLLPPYSLRR